MTLTVLILWVFFSLVAFQMAQNKGVSGLAALFVSLIFSPLIGIIAVLVSRPSQAVLDRRAIKSGRSKRCPYCDELIKSAALVCKHCGRDMPATNSEK